MKLVVLLSCMNQQNSDIINKTNIQTDAVVINQCDEESIRIVSFTNKKGKLCNVTFVNTLQRGLSRSRNMAIEYAHGDIGLLCDDDECLDDNYEDTILAAHAINSSAVIAFSLIRLDNNKQYPKKQGYVSFYRMFSTNSIQLTFKLDQLRQNHICFDQKMGSGSGNGGGEEVKFMMDCRRSGLKLFYIPQNIAQVNINPSGSHWFHGYTLKFFKDLAWSTRRTFHPFIGSIYVVYVIFSKRKKYKNNYTSFQIMKAMVSGWKERR